jgi:2-amino-4-hydroxy-6-hydroxymethyldihydropteridine diphosphokinase
MPKLSRIFLSLSSTADDRVSHLRTAIDHLRAIMTLERFSSLYVVAPLGHMEADAVVSAVIEGTTELKPVKLLKALKQIEKLMGRKPDVTYGPQTIDLDILFYDTIIIEALELIIPHPRIPERAYILKPLTEIAPNLMHPVLYYTIRELLRDADEADQVIPFTSHDMLPKK